MSTAVFPTLAGLGWDVKRGQEFRTTKPVSVSGMEVAIANWQYPRYMWELKWNVIRQGSINGTTYTEHSTLFGFYNSRQGGFDSFLYNAEDDNTVTTQQIGLGTGSATVFPLVRTYGGFTEPVLAPNLSLTFNLYVSAVLVNPIDYTVTPWETGNVNGPGRVIFNSPPALSAPITATYSYYWPCRFMEDQCVFAKFLDQRYKVEKLTFKSIKMGS